VDRQWFGQYYRDVLKNVFGGGANTDADERPTLMYRYSTHVSGFDVDGTGDASLGTYTGKSIVGIQNRLPRFFAPEHGTIFCMACLRFPVVSTQEVHYLTNKPQPTYLQLSGDQDLWRAEPPIQANAADHFKSGGSDLGLIPWGQYYRTQPSVVHQRFATASQFPFYESVPNSKETARYCQNGEYFDIFQTSAFEHWQHHASVVIDKSTVVPGPKSSMYAGVLD
jgi:hypothetical protein